MEAGAEQTKSCSFCNSGINQFDNCSLSAPPFTDSASLKVKSILRFNKALEVFASTTT